MKYVKISIIATILLCIFSCKERPSKYPFNINSKIVDQQNIEWKSYNIYLKEEVEKFIKSRTESIYSLLESSYDPYQGTSSLPEICRKESLPIEIKTESSLQLFIYSSSERALGNCDNPSNLLKTNYLLLHCEKKLFAIKYFYEQSKPWFKGIIANCKIN